MKSIQKEKLTLEQIKKIVSENKPYLQKKYNVKTIGIFGSYVRGEQVKKSDIDILVEFEEESKMDLFTFIEMEMYLSNIFDVKVDLVMKNSLKPYIGKSILKEVQYL